MRFGREVVFMSPLVHRWTVHPHLSSVRLVVIAPVAAGLGAGLGHLRHSGESPAFYLCVKRKFVEFDEDSCV